MRAMLLFLALFSSLPSIAKAHPGDHGHLGFEALFQHFVLEPDHLVFMALTVIVGFTAYRLGRRVEAKAQSRRRQP